MKSANNTEKKAHYIRKVSRQKEQIILEKCPDVQSISGKGQIYMLSNG
jgi:hypothetical protein